MAYSEERTETVTTISELPDLSEEEQKLAEKKLQEIRKKWSN